MRLSIRSTEMHQSKEKDTTVGFDLVEDRLFGEESNRARRHQRTSRQITARKTVGSQGEDIQFRLSDIQRLSVLIAKFLQKIIVRKFQFDTFDDN